MKPPNYIIVIVFSFFEFIEMIICNICHLPLSQLSRTGSVDLDPRFPEYIFALPKNLKTLF